jgi:Dipeptidyl peptidase IV (DPP IV) N-terminal region
LPITLRKRKWRVAMAFGGVLTQHTWRLKVLTTVVTALFHRGHCRHCVCTECDETHIPLYRIMHQGKDGVGEDAQEDHRCLFGDFRCQRPLPLHSIDPVSFRYPFAGAANPRVRLGVVDLTGDVNTVSWMDLGPDPVPNIQPFSRAP